MNQPSDKYSMSARRHRQVFNVNPSEIEMIKEKVLYWSCQYNTFSFLDNNLYHIPPNRYELLAGVNAVRQLIIPHFSSCQDWVFGRLDFEYDNADDKTYHAFIPETVIYVLHDQHHELVVESFLDTEGIYNAVMQQNITIHKDKSVRTDYEWTWQVDKSFYIRNVELIKNDIFNGRYYELNYCVPCYLNIDELDSKLVFLRQKALNPSPFSALYKNQGRHVICLSPERFLFSRGKEIFCQPIKGTSPKNDDPEKDALQKVQLYHSEKDRAENVMIVDLTRNDLYRCCEDHSVEVPELFGIYTFPFVHQMISTVSGRLRDGMSFDRILEVTYPMGSMTGAPKKTVIDHIRQYELGKRGAYSGTIFYIQPDGHFDSNVVIRSLIYDESIGRLQFHTGGAITYDSSAESEWEEILWKSQSMLRSME